MSRRERARTTVANAASFVISPPPTDNSFCCWVT
jgi:hypothetical protein